jgi:hypothetical protein
MSVTGSGGPSHLVLQPLLDQLGRHAHRIAAAAVRRSGRFAQVNDRRLDARMPPPLVASAIVLGRRDDDQVSGTDVGGPDRPRSLVIGSQVAKGASALGCFQGLRRAFGRIGKAAERSRFVPQPSTCGPQGNFDRLSRPRRKPFQNLQNVIAILQIRRAEIRAPDNLDASGLMAWPMQEQPDFRIDVGDGRGLRPQMGVSWQYDGRARLWRYQGSGPLHQRQRKRVDAEIDGAVRRADCQQRFPGTADAVAVDRIIRLRAEILPMGEDHSDRSDRPPRPVQAAKSLAQCIERRCFGDQPVEVDINTGLDCLGGDNDERLNQMAVGVRSDRTQVIDDLLLSVGRACRTDDQNDEGFRQILLQSLEHRTGTRDAIDDDADDRCRDGLSQFPKGCFRVLGELLGSPMFDRYALLAGNLHQLGRLRRRQPFRQDRVAAVVFAQTELNLTLSTGRRGQQRHIPGSLISCPEPLDRSEGLPERFGEMRLIEQDQAIRAEQAGVDRLHPVADPVTAEQQTRADLVHGGA